MRLFRPVHFQTPRAELDWAGRGGLRHAVEPVQWEFNEESGPSGSTVTASRRGHRRAAPAVCQCGPRATGLAWTGVPRGPAVARTQQPDPGIVAAFRPAARQPGQPRGAAGHGPRGTRRIPPAAPAGRHHARDPQAAGPAQPRQRNAGGRGGRGGPAALGRRRRRPAAPGRGHDVRPGRRLVRGDRRHQRPGHRAGPGPGHPDLRRRTLQALRPSVELHGRAVPRS